MDKKENILDGGHKFKMVGSNTNEELEKKFKSIESSLDLLSYNYGPQSMEVEMATEMLREGDIEAAYNSLSSTVHFDDLTREIEELKAKVLGKS